MKGERSDDMNIHVNVTVSPDQEVQEMLDDILSVVVEMKEKQEKIMALLDTLTASVAENTTQVGKISAVIDGINAQLKAALALANPEETVAAVKVISDQIDVNNAAIAALAAANTPPVEQTPSG